MDGSRPPKAPERASPSECGDLSPLSHGATCRPDPHRAPAPALQTADDHAAGLTRAAVLAEAERLMAQGYSLRQAAAALRISPAWLCTSAARVASGGPAALRPGRRGAGSGAAGTLTVRLEAIGWFIPAARFYYLISNRTWNRGCVAEAIRRAVSLPHVPAGWKHTDTARLLKAIALAELPTCPPDLREEILDRQARGQALVPERIARQITSSAARVRAYRNPREFALDCLSAPGAMRCVRDVVTGELRLARALEIVEGDDATINFPVCVPWSFGGTPSADKFGVLVGRFQWLVFVDVGTGKVLGYTYTMRPRSSYRGEDVLAGMRGVVRQHGVPKTWRFEQGVWKSNLVKGAVQGMGSRLETVHSPHQKPFIEGLFNVLWTKLSVHFPQAHVGRFQGEQKESCDVLTACQRGQRDPRRHFPLLSQVLAAFDEAIAEKDATPLDSAHHGRWIPAERFAEQIAANPPRHLDPESDWVFSPFVREWTVRGMLVGGRVPLFEGLSVPFDFSAPFLPDLDGARVKCYFDPSEPKCFATVCLAEAWNGKPVGTVLGSAAQVNETARYARLALGYGDDAEKAGQAARQIAAKAVRREVRATVPNGRAESHERDGLGTSTTYTRGTEGQPSPAPSGDDVGASPARLGQRAGSPQADSPATHSPALSPDPDRLARLAAFEREHDLEFVG